MKSNIILFCSLRQKKILYKFKTINFFLLIFKIFLERLIRTCIQFLLDINNSVVYVNVGRTIFCLNYVPNFLESKRKK